MTDHALAVLGGILGGALVTGIAFVYYLSAPRWRG